MLLNIVEKQWTKLERLPWLSRSTYLPNLYGLIIKASCKWLNETHGESQYFIKYIIRRSILTQELGARSILTGIRFIQISELAQIDKLFTLFSLPRSLYSIRPLRAYSDLILRRSISSEFTNYKYNFINLLITIKYLNGNSYFLHRRKLEVNLDRNFSPHIRAYIYNTAMKYFSHSSPKIIFAVEF